MKPWLERTDKYIYLPYSQCTVNLKWRPTGTHDVVSTVGLVSECQKLPERKPAEVLAHV